MLPKDGSLTLTYKDNQTSAGREKGLASTGAADVQSSEHGEIWGPLEGPGNIQEEHSIKPEEAHGTHLVVQWQTLCTPNAEGPGSIPGQGTRSHLPQQRLKLPRAATKTQCSQLNI